VRRKRDGVIRKRTTLYLSPEMARRLAVYSAETDRDMSEIAEEALGSFLSKRSLDGREGRAR
jgi:predicted transcriptional regulator